jgi:AcrR family transcriptional regulator
MVKKTPLEPDGNKSARTRERLLRSTAQVLRTQNYADVRLVEIAERAGMEAGSLYYYFDSKDQLVEAVVRFGVQHARENVQKAIKDIDVEFPAERLREALRAFTHDLHGEDDFTAAAVRTLGQLPVHLRDKCQTQNMYFGRFWDGLFTAMRKAGMLREDIDAKLARHLVLSAIIRSTDWPESYRRSPGQIAETLWAALFEGLLRDGTHPLSDTSDHETLASLG